MDNDTFTQYKQVRYMRVLVLLWLAYTSYTMVRRPLSISRVNIEKELGISAANLSLADTAYVAAYAASQFCYVMLKARFDYKALLLIGLAGSAVSCFILALSYNLFFLIVAWTLNGLVQGAGWASCMGIINNWVFPDERGTILGIWSTNMAVGGVVGNIVVSWMIGRNMSWRAATVMVSLLGPVPFGIVTALFLLQHPNQYGYPSVEQVEVGMAMSKLSEAPNLDSTINKGNEVPASPSNLLHRHGKEEIDRFSESGETQTYVTPEAARHANQGNSEQPKQESRYTPLLLLSLPGVAAYSLSYFINKLVRYSFMFWLPYYLSKELHANAQTAGYVSSFFDAGGMVGIVLSGYCSDRFFEGKRRALVLFFFTVGMALSTMSLGAFSGYFVDHMWQCSVAVFVVGFFSFAVDALQTSSCLLWLCEAINAPVGPVSGLVGGIGSLGSVLQGYVTALLTSSSWSTLFFTFGVATLVAAAVLLRVVVLESNTRLRARR